VDAGCASRLVAERRLCKAERGSVRGPIPVGHTTDTSGHHHRAAVG